MYQVSSAITVELLYCGQY